MIWNEMSMRGDRSMSISSDKNDNYSNDDNKYGQRDCSTVQVVFSVWLGGVGVAGGYHSATWRLLLWLAKVA